MVMKTVLVPLESVETLPAILGTALAFARHFGSMVEGVASMPIVDNYIVGEMVPLWPPQQRGPSETPQDLAGAFRQAMEDAGAPARERAPDGLRYGWREPALMGDSAVASLARAYDVTVVGRPSSNPAGPRLSLLEAILFESGRPILIAPPGTAPAAIGERVVVAWNGSTETARTVAFAMPVLRQARQVIVLTVEGASVPGPSGEDLTRTLRANQIEAEPLTLAPAGRQSGEAFLEHASAIGADLVVKGAYTQSRLRQMIFGGATSFMLANATVPVFMAH
jgi:nucleotide-binding universal stress UspA family protein